MSHSPFLKLAALGELFELHSTPYNATTKRKVPRLFPYKHQQYSVTLVLPIRCSGGQSNL